MKSITARIYKALLWQAINYKEQLALNKGQTATAFHDVRNLINHIEKPPRSLIYLLNEILDRAKHENKSPINSKDNFSLMEMLSELEEIFASALLRKNLKWISNYDIGSNLYISSEKSKIMQILSNLLGNACKFTEKGFIKVTARYDITRDKVYFLVSDSGIGITQENLGSLFKEYTQIHNTASLNEISGSGLGLSISKGLVSSLGGSLEVESTIGVGTKFSFEIPCKNLSSVNLSKKSSDYRTNKNKTTFTSNRVLLIEDDLTICELISKFFEERHITCDFTHQGSTAINLCNNFPKNYYSLIITDMFLNDGDGLSLVKVFKNFIGVNCPVVLMSGSDISSAYKYFDDIIRKPAQINSLEKMAKKYLKYEFSEDTASALKSVLDKHKVKFRENYKDSSEKLELLFEAKDFKELRNYAHSIKGLTATLGYEKLASTSGEIEAIALKLFEMKAEVSEHDSNKLSLAIENYNKALLNIYFL